VSHSRAEHSVRERASGPGVATKPLLLTLLSLSCAPGPPPSDPDHLHYRIATSIEPASHFLEASVDLSFRSPSAGLRAAEFLLHRSLEVRTVSGPGVAGFRVDTLEVSAPPWIPDAARVEVSFTSPLDSGAVAPVHFEYAGAVDSWPSWSANVITAGWSELGLYFPWFPYGGEAYGPFSFEVEARLPAGYVATGWGEPSPSGTRWRLVQDDPVSDIVLLASKDLRTRRFSREGRTVWVHYVTLDDSTAEELATDVLSTLEFFDDWYGPGAGRRITLAESKRESGGGYAREGLLVLGNLARRSSPEERPDLLRYLAHETAHFWWTGAPSDTWEDWLNESFAEYSALLLLRHRFGEAEFRERMRRKEEASEGAPPIRGFDRAGDEAAVVLYDAGPVLLNRLAERLSEPRFLEWCRALAAREVRSTVEALAILVEREGIEAAAWLEAALEGRSGPEP